MKQVTGRQRRKGGTDVLIEPSRNAKTHFGGSETCRLRPPTTLSKTVGCAESACRATGNSSLVPRSIAQPIRESEGSASRTRQYSASSTPSRYKDIVAKAHYSCHPGYLCPVHGSVELPTRLVHILPEALAFERAETRTSQFLQLPRTRADYSLDYLSVVRPCTPLLIQ